MRPEIIIMLTNNDIWKAAKIFRQKNGGLKMLDFQKMG